MDATLAQYGPVSNEVLNQQHTHRSHFIEHEMIDINKRLKTRHSSGIFWSVRHHLDPVGQAATGRLNQSARLHWRVVQRLYEMGFYGVYRCGVHKVNHSLITALVERWRPETHTFHFRFGEATVTLQDVSFLWALPIDGLPVISSHLVRPKSYWLGLCQELLGWTPQENDIRGSYISMLSLGKYLRDRILTDFTPVAEVDQYARGVALILLASVMCPTTSGAMGSLKYLSHLADLDRCKEYSWGSAVLALLYNNLCVASTTDSANIGGAMELLQVWAWSRIMFVRPTLIGERVQSEPYMTPVSTLPIPPYGAEFASYHDLTEVLSTSLTSLREAFDRHTSDQFTWQPYEPYPWTIDQYIRNGIIRISNTWLSKCPLIHYNIVELYHPERVLRQFGMRQSIPPAITDDHQALYVYASQGRSGNTDWVQEHSHWRQAWRDRSNHVVEAPMVYQGESTVEEDYPQWYERITRRLITPRVNVSHGYQPMPYADTELAVRTAQRYNQVLSNPELGQPFRGLCEQIYTDFSQYPQPAIHRNVQLHDFFPPPAYSSEGHQLQHDFCEGTSQHHFGEGTSQHHYGQGASQQHSGEGASQHHQSEGISQHEFGGGMTYATPSLGVQDYEPSFTHLLQSGNMPDISFMDDQWYNSYADQRPTMHSSPVPFSLDINMEPTEECDDGVNIMPEVGPSRPVRPKRNAPRPPCGTGGHR